MHVHQVVVIERFALPKGYKQGDLFKDWWSGLKEHDLTRWEIGGPGLGPN